MTYAKNMNIHKHIIPFYCLNIKTTKIFYSNVYLKGTLESTKKSS